MVEKLIRNNFFIATCAGIATIGTFLLFVQTVEASYVLAVFFGTKFLYSLLRKGTTMQQKVVRNQFLIQQGGFALFSFIGLVLAMPNISQWHWVIVSFLLVLLYGGYIFFPRLKQFSIRKNGWLKLVCIGVVWSILTTIVPFDAMNQGMHYRNYLYAFVQFLFIMALTLPFEIMETQNHENDGFQTIPDKIGSHLSKKLGRGLIFSCWIIAGFVSLPVFYSMIICSILYLRWIHQDIQNQTLHQITLRFDGLIILQSVLMILFHQLMT